MSNSGALLLNICLLIVLSIILLGQVFVDSQQDDINWGVSFSKPQAQYLGNDWQDNFSALLDDMKVRRFRLMSYWNQIEPEDDSFDFADLDWQMKQAANRDAQVSLAIGYRQPRWPECHVPVWLDTSSKRFDAELDQYLRTVAKRYKNHPALSSWQLENEISNRLFGECDNLEFSPQRLNREIAILNEITPEVPIYNSTGNQSGVPVNRTDNDGYAFSIYDNAYFEAAGREWEWDFWYIPPIWHSARAQVIEIIHNKPTFIHELQLEPWGPSDLASLSQAEQNESMSPDTMRQLLNYGRRTGFSTIDLWGSEWWYQQLQNGNSEPWQVTASVFDR